MITHDWLINNGYSWRRFEGESENSWAGEYIRRWLNSDDQECSIYIYKLSENKDDFNKTDLEVRSDNNHLSMRLRNKTLLFEQINILTNIICK